ncbi:WD40 repeat-containing protein, putative [Bodo saltans]|uniref:DDB1- and CUL4-associated factor 13 n=1 Tax=Bodo saltans TaxID=75058 RepID=A0A0S4J6C2_BODSA|nr:WD40 repeat-containing protein, putative [Bodo saltans]|eukprot:CUG40778.1 WD40 repeat-containing protein, putative [Bodo saltans]
MVKVKMISRSNLEWSKDRSGEVPRAHRNYDPTLNPMSKQVEFTRAVRAAKLDRMFAKPFVGALNGHIDTVKSLATDLTNVGTLVSGAMDGGLIVWDTMLKKPRVTINAHKNSVEGVCVSPDGVACFSASSDKIVRMWDMDQSETLAGSEPLPVAEYLGDFPFSSIDHHYRRPHFATSSEFVLIWDVNRTKPVQKFEWGDDTVSHCRLNKVESDLLACCMTDRGVCVYDLRTKCAHTKVVMEMCCTSLSWSPMDPNVFVAGSDDWNCYLFDLRLPGRPRNVFQGHIHPVTSVDFAPTGTHFCAGSQDNTVRVWELSQTTKSTSQELFHTKRMAKVFSVKWSLDNNYIFSGSEDANVRIWKADASRPIRPLRGAEKNSFNYLRALRDKYSNFQEVRKITNQRNTPKFIRKTALRKKRIQLREAVKEMSRTKSDNLKPLAKRKVVQSIK